MSALYTVCKGPEQYFLCTQALAEFYVDLQVGEELAAVIIMEFIF